VIGQALLAGHSKMMIRNDDAHNTDDDGGKNKQKD
jgi:hypothetical protein